jgi:hypothetical protein
VLPPVLSGGLIDSEVQSDWYEGALHFSGYHTTFTFTKLLFKPNAQGLYTLTDGFVGAESGNVIEDLTNPGETGTCTATFEFARQGGAIADATLTGNVGSLSRSANGWNAVIELGVTLPGVITSSSNCGPNEESTAHQFGEPPKITIPIIATGELDSASGTLTVDSTKKEPVAGKGELTDDVTGTLLDKIVP